MRRRTCEAWPVLPNFEGPNERECEGEENLGIFEGSELQLYMKAGVASSEVGDAEGHVECGNGGQ